jgi:RNA recognition motif-containing protein
MSRTLHVSNLNIIIDDSELKRLFSSAGAVRTARVITSQTTGSSTGTGLVEMSQEKEGAVAVAMLHGQEHLGQRLTVRVATLRDESDAANASMYGPMNLVDDADLQEI